MGEAAIEEIIKKEFIDWTVGYSRYYNVADLSQLGLNVGVKTVKYGNFPVIHKNPERPEIINFIKNDNRVIVCGLATLDSLQLYQDDNYILDWRLRRKGTKTCFTGFSDVIQFRNYKELKNAYYTDQFLQKIA